ncbi:nucleoside deaminase [Methanocella sp. CWC-04]|uniref:Nucleoside deaminase n=1 Tax=Methanooceanicella nereidis TaxID=2052831 RepID=A0AAP2RGW6_9EURY|nr:nucleoside deaminase [Methanocella sp. CWC-04]MCD1295960.1 nucleoside deaminase [Methanocella sp. CWC-04]
MDDESFMRIAIEKAKEGIMEGQNPFGACIVKDGKIISCEHNMIVRDTDITSHAEINAIREACKRLGTTDLSGCTIYCTCEPCTMCFTACYLASISKIVHGARIRDGIDYGFDVIEISNEEMKKRSAMYVNIIGDFLRDENLELFRLWHKLYGDKEQSLLKH